MGSRERKAIRRSERVEMRFLEAVKGRCPDNGRVLEVLGELYTRTGRYEDGLKVDLELTRINPRESIAWYNLACSYALVGKKNESLNALEKAVEWGYSDFDWMRRDKDLGILRGDPRFEALLKKARR
jgi:tetratricopeptide (TPR) repeat protein